jgi:hypothetical protein
MRLRHVLEENQERRGRASSAVTSDTAAIPHCPSASVSWPAREGLMAWIAAAAVISCTVHMLRMGKHMKKHIDGQLGAATQKQGSAGWWAVFAFAVFMVGREGVETATMIASLSRSTATSPTWRGAVRLGSRSPHGLRGCGRATAAR